MKFLQKKYLIIAAIVVVCLGVLIWLFLESIKPLPGQKIDDLGRGHVPLGTEVPYNSNPPTSGQHYEDWVKAGVYSEVKDDRNLVHSLEHGYVIMSYNCDSKIKNQSLNIKIIKLALAQEEQQQPQVATSSAETSPSATLSSDFQSDDCKKLVEKLTKVYNDKGTRKLVVVPRPNLDSKLALTAWNYLDKFNNFDEERIKKFIDGHRDKGPELTME